MMQIVASCQASLHSESGSLVHYSQGWECKGRWLAIGKKDNKPVQGRR